MSESQPNILLITTDQQRHDTVGPHAPRFLHTPHCDWLTRVGARFSSAYADCPICVPSRVSIMTGKTVFGHGMPANGVSSRVMGDRETLPAHMRALGYTTAAIGKMHFNPQRTRHGFEEMVLPDDYYREMTCSGEVQQPMRHGIGQNELHPAMATVPESRTLTAWTAERCVDYITHRRDPLKPFFLWCSFSKPHPPLDPPEPYWSMYKNADIPSPVESDWCGDDAFPAPMRRFRQKHSYDRLSPEMWRDARVAYYGLITQIDYNIGRVLAALSESGELGNTLILYTSDHGEYLGDHHMGSKAYFHEPSAHVPFLLRLPNTWSDRGHGTTVEMPVTLADVMPTCIAAGGGTPPGDAEGRDLAAVIQGRDDADRADVMGMARTSCDTADYVGLTDGRWKYIWHPEGGQEQLFDLHEDPGETRNLATHATHDEQRRALHNTLIERLEERGSELVRNGALVTEPVQEHDERDARDATPLGLRLAHSEADVRH